LRAEQQRRIEQSSKRRAPQRPVNRVAENSIEALYRFVKMSLPKPTRPACPA
jgi:hypothetical protein